MAIEKREKEENKRRAKLLILCGLESLNTHNATSSAGILYGLESLNTYNGHLRRERERERRECFAILTSRFVSLIIAILKASSGETL